MAEKRASELPKQLIGFDVRRPGELGSMVMRRQEAGRLFQPRGDGAGPWMTMDKYVNPSLFLHHDVWEARGRPVTDRMLVDPHSNVGYDLFHLWDDQMDMVAHYSGDATSRDAALAYAWVNVAPGAATTPDETLDAMLEIRTRPATIPSNWPLLGFDIVTSGYISFLAGFDHDGMDAGSLAWFAARIDQRFGLLSPAAELDLGAAVTLANRLAGEDPFFAVAIFVIWDNSHKLPQPTQA